MTDHMKSFLTELAKLMKEHGIDFNIEEQISGYASYPIGIELSQESIYDDSNNQIRDYSYLTLPTCFDYKYILKIIGDEDANK